MAASERRFFPSVGDGVELPYSDGTPSIVGHVTHAFGSARLFQVQTPAGEVGVVAIQPSGTWWWILAMDEPDESEGWKE